MVGSGASALHRHAGPEGVRAHLKEDGGGDPLIKVLNLRQECLLY